MKVIPVAWISLCVPFVSIAQHTFSIVAIDPVTREIGSAGATCLDSLLTGGYDASGISGIWPGKGVIHAQSYLNETNLQNGLGLIRDGFGAANILEWLLANDVESLPQYRQYGIATITGAGAVNIAGYTGERGLNEKGHITGPTYAIQGNILISTGVLTAMEQYFNACNGSLADKLMHALRAAGFAGADIRCLPEGISSQSAFIRVAKPGDNPLDLYLDIKVRTRPYGTDAIALLEERFTAWKSIHEPDADDLGIAGFSGPLSAGNLSSDETIRVRVQNYGTQAQASYRQSYSINGGPVVTETVDMPIAENSSSVRAFETRADLSAYGVYHLKAFAVADHDELNTNDTLETLITNYAPVDAGIRHLPKAFDGECTRPLNIALALTNHGIEPLQRATIETWSGPQLLQSDTWEGHLEVTESDSLVISVLNPKAGINDLVFRVTSPNGTADYIAANDTVAYQFTYSLFKEEVKLTIRTDDYPLETSWEIRDPEGVPVWKSKGYYLVPQHTYVENFCLDAGTCYTFTIFDDLLDGICCAYGPGFYRIHNSSGIVLASGGVFQASDTRPFCLEPVSAEQPAGRTQPARAYPVPSDHIVILESDLFHHSPVTISMVTPAGSTALEIRAPVSPAGIYAVDISTLPTGMYWVYLVSSAGKDVVKVARL